MSQTRINKVILAYSGGLDTSVIVPWLRDHYNCEVICFCADIGLGEEISGLPEVDNQNIILWVVLAVVALVLGFGIVLFR